MALEVKPYEFYLPFKGKTLAPVIFDPHMIDREGYIDADHIQVARDEKILEGAIVTLVAQVRIHNLVNLVERVGDLRERADMQQWIAQGLINPSDLPLTLRLELSSPSAVLFARAQYFLAEIHQANQVGYLTTLDDVDHREGADELPIQINNSSFPAGSYELKDRKGAELSSRLPYLGSELEAVKIRFIQIPPEFNLG